MYVPEIELHEPVTLQEAGQLVERYAPHARLLAGGTDLLVDLKTGRVETRHLVSIQRLEELRGVKANGDGLRIGALTTPSQLSDTQVVCERFAALLDATRDMASPQIRNAATIGGNIASAVSCADLPPILTVMSASVTVRTPSDEKTLPLDGFFVGPRQTVLRPGALITEIRVPPLPERYGCAYARFGLRRGLAIPVASAAAGLRLNDDGTIAEGRVVLGAVAPTPVVVEQAAALLAGQTPGTELFDAVGSTASEAAQPISDVRGSADFRREVVGVMTRRALETALKRAKEVKP